MTTIVIPKIPITVYNTEKREKVNFVPQEDSVVRMYTCGPTVYDFAHIGNFRTFVFEDLLRRTLKFFGYQVIHVMNITDLDDKTIKGATKLNIPLKDFVQPYKNAFFVDLSTLLIEPAEYYPLATDYIPHMIDFIQNLLDKKMAYKSKDHSIYYPIGKCAHYGRLCHLKMQDLKTGAGDETQVMADEYDKDNASDFVLWKAYDSSRDGTIFWESPFGPGRPGWHLECSTMAMSILGETIDIHCGAVDNIFPHHENEIAQSESYSGKTFVRYWMHSEHLLVNHKKMSKSLGNFYNLRDLLDKGYRGVEVRYLLMQAHYRTQLNFTNEGLEASRNALQRLNDFVKRLQEKAGSDGSVSSHVEQLTHKAMNQFAYAMADDLNISVALASLFDLMHEVNKLTLIPADALLVLQYLQQFNRVLGVMNFEEEEIPKEILDLLEKRQQARANKQWKEADFFRDEITRKGYGIEDTPKGPRFKKI